MEMEVLSVFVEDITVSIFNSMSSSNVLAVGETVFYNATKGVRPSAGWDIFPWNGKTLKSPVFNFVPDIELLEEAFQ